MKVLIIGSGSREHALGWKIKKDHPDASLFIAPGNGGTAEIGENLPIQALDLQGLLKWAEANRPDLVWVGPEGPLCVGIVDLFESRGFAIFGPNKAAARLEESKVFSKSLLQKYNIPTAKGESFKEVAHAKEFSRKLKSYPQVVKADGLASGKGVIIAQNEQEVDVALDQIMVARAFGEAGSEVVIEEFLEGQEASIHVVTDGETYQFFPVAQDHKRIGENDTGLNTGGMGAYAPVDHLVDASLREKISKTILDPFFAGLKKEKISFHGILYAGLMITAEGPKVIEFNVRFGDPETQVLLPLLKSSLVELAEAVRKRKLKDFPLEWDALFTVAVVMAAENYPGTPRTGDAIEGLDSVKNQSDVFVFHGGTENRNGKTVTSGGRVLTVTAWASTLEKARQLAYEHVEKIKFKGEQYRRDIGAKAFLSKKSALEKGINT